MANVSQRRAAKSKQIATTALNCEATRDLLDFPSSIIGSRGAAIDVVVPSKGEDAGMDSRTRELCEKLESEGVEVRFVEPLDFSRCPSCRQPTQRQQKNGKWYLVCSGALSDDPTCAWHIPAPRQGS